MDVEMREPVAKRPGPRGSKWPGIVAFLKDSPGEWGMVGEYAVSVAPAMRRGEYAAFLPEGFDGDKRAYMRDNWDITIVTLGQDRKRCELFIRYMGE